MNQSIHSSPKKLLLNRGINHIYSPVDKNTPETRLQIINEGLMFRIMCG